MFPDWSSRLVISDLLEPGFGGTGDNFAGGSETGAVTRTVPSFFSVIPRHYATHMRQGRPSGVSMT